jgi:3-hydroxyacyl-[acyl-carrier-protein] dehydratase
MTFRRYDAAQLHQLLAHRYPFLLVDAIDVVEPGSLVIGRKLLSAGEWWSAASSSIPSVLVLEALAQTSAAVLADLVDGATGAVGYFASANRVRFRHGARVGDELLLRVALIHWRRGICRTRGVATLSNGAVVATAELTTVLRASL